ncbi:5'-methylthioadenosine/S-adenosylhomocysteine nucleosidase [Pararhodobacter oceanensis]|uniref:5'-methylthioadenosine/S-adenosylhomocysteine nucleosidase n=1 Tax=Pararhodobacter oceanensis TaxID=2172121 RepID=A0A2T8HT96_9RHOB|nr:5'-methylthioadenosine/S-adenosylhomocysteine nucleosidase [Pararhodobacter oceanensis]
MRSPAPASPPSRAAPDASVRNAPLPALQTTASGHCILYVMAAEQEYGPHLRARISPLITGVGPIEAAITTATALTRLAQVGTPPDLIVSLGSAGSARLSHCGLYQADSVAWRDINAAPLGIAPGTTPFATFPAILPLPLRLPDLPSASLSTGGDIVTGKGFDAIAQDMVDMETYAIARAAMVAQTPLIALRGISDGQAPVTGLHDWTEYLHIIDAKLATAIDTIPAALETGLLCL